MRNSSGRTSPGAMRSSVARSRKASRTSCEIEIFQIAQAAVNQLRVPAAGA